MMKLAFEAVIQTLSARNSALTALYKEGAKSLLSRPVTSLASSMADQRREFGKELSALALSCRLGTEPLDIEIQALPSLDPAPPQGGVAGLLGRMKEAEAEDYELLTALSGAVLPASAEAAERLAGLAEQARKRSTWAQDHLDLLGI